MKRLITIALASALIFLAGAQDLPPPTTLTLTIEDIQKVKVAIEQIQAQEIAARKEAEKWRAIYGAVHECAKEAAANGLPILPCFNYDEANGRSHFGRDDLTED